MLGMEHDWQTLRLRMVNEQLKARGIHNERVLAAMREVPREEFCDPQTRHLAYEDRPVPIGVEQTISQPYMVAEMAAILDLQPQDTVLDVGCGSGYAAAVMSRLCAHVYGVELVRALADGARERLARLGYNNVTIHCGDGRLGWAEHAPYDAINVAAASADIPEALLDQLAEGGRLLIPLGRPDSQSLTLCRRTGSKLHRQFQGFAAFIPLVKVRAS
jgi:protein-L-isoaspartate(D-aspartate) O-methyltransferase